MQKQIVDAQAVSTRLQGELDPARASAKELETQLQLATDRAADLDLRAVRAETDLAALKAQQKPAKKR